MLTKRLGSHPDIHTQGELLNYKLNYKLTVAQHRCVRVGRWLGLKPSFFNLQFNGQNFLRLTDNLAWGRSYQHVGACGFKLIIDQWTNLSVDQKNAFLSTHDVKVIVLRRENTLCHLVSERQAKENGYLHRAKNQPELHLPPVEINLDDLRTFQKSIYIRSSLARAAFVKCPIIDIAYEDLVANPERENARLLEFIGVCPHPLSDSLAKNSSGDLSERIVNFEAFAHSIRGTIYEAMLSDQTVIGA